MQMQEPQLPGILVVVGSKGMPFFCNSLLGKATVGHIYHHEVVIAYIAIQVYLDRTGTAATCMAEDVRR